MKSSVAVPIRGLHSALSWTLGAFPWGVVELGTYSSRSKEAKPQDPTEAAYSIVGDSSSRS